MKDPDIFYLKKIELDTRIAKQLINISDSDLWYKIVSYLLKLLLMR